MRVLLSTIGSRGDVQPLVALAVALREIGHEVRFCVPPDFREWIEGIGFPVTPIGPELRTFSPPVSAAGSGPPSPEQLRRMAEGTVADQFETITRAAAGVDLIVGATALQIAAPSVAEGMSIPYVFAAYCPAVLPSAHHAPPPLRVRGDAPTPAAGDHSAVWAEDARRWNATWGPALNSRRVAAGLAPVEDVRSHVLTDRPWLASDPVLAPWPEAHDPAVLQTGAWILPDERPLAPELERFLDAGDPPVYFGFGSMRAPQEVGRAMIEAARSLGLRSILSRGWAGFSPADGADDCFTVDEVNHRTLFGRVAAVVHHGGAGTTTAAALAGVPQAVAPQMYDQYYFAGRVRDLGIGTAHAPEPPTGASLAAALEACLRPGVAARTREIAGRMPTDGAATAARRLVADGDGRMVATTPTGAG